MDMAGRPKMDLTNRNEVSDIITMQIHGLLHTNKISKLRMVFYTAYNRKHTLAFIDHVEFFLLYG